MTKFLRRVLTTCVLKWKHCLALDFPSDFYLEVTSACNLRCPACVRTYSKRPRQHMDKSIFRKAIEEISSERPNLEHLGLHFFGEALLNPQFFDFIELARSYLPNTYLAVSSNASFLSSEKTDKLLNSSLDSFGIWPDTTDPRQYDQIRTGGSLEIVESNLKELLEKRRLSHREDIEVHIGMILFKDNLPFLHDFLERWKLICSRYENVHIVAAESHDWAGEVPSDNVLNSVARSSLFIKVPCLMLMPFRNCVISAEGYITPCCFDGNLKLGLGNIKDDSIKNIWNGKAASDLREKMITASILPSDLCWRCHAYNANIFSIWRMLPGTRGIFRKPYDKYALSHLRSLKRVSALRKG